MARDYMIQKESWSSSSAPLSDSATTTSASSDYESDQWDGECWTRQQAKEYAQKNNRCLIVLSGYAVDVTRYLGEHVRLSCRDFPRFPGTGKGLTRSTAWRCFSFATVRSREGGEQRDGR